jgi:hypothetical protein
MPGKKILLVEGTDDEHVLKHVCGNRGVGTLDAVKPQGSVDLLLESFPVRLKESDISALGVIIDADTDLAARWRSIRDRLIRAGFQDVPTDPVPTGTLLNPPADTLLPRTGIWIMPNNKTPGILEDFVRFMVPAGNTLFTRVENTVDGIPENERRFSLLARPKAIIHTWLAWQEEPGKPLGTAITARFLDPDVPEVDALVNWLTQLFFPPAA